MVKSNPAEIGMMDINFTKEKNKDNLFSKFPDKLKVYNGILMRFKE